MYRGTDSIRAVLGLTDINSAVTKLLVSVSRVRETTKTEAARWTRWSRTFLGSSEACVCVLEKTRAKRASSDRAAKTTHRGRVI